jgi:hypothetical protein
MFAVLTLYTSTSARDIYTTVFTVEDQKGSETFELLGKPTKCWKNYPRDILLMIVE